jgi:hypothetical protein
MRNDFLFISVFLEDSAIFMPAGLKIRQQDDGPSIRPLGIFIDAPPRFIPYPK